MIGRFLKGIILGLVIGGLAAACLIKWLNVGTFAVETTPLLAYASALATGAAVGLVAGKPIWAKGAGIEALLKTFFGALLGAGGMFLLRKFADFPFPLDLTRFGLAAGKVSDLVFVALPAVATVLSVLFELDNTDAPPEKGARVAGKAAATKAAAPSTARARRDDDEDDAEDAAATRKAKK
jgi:hypothetical protein